ncbi:DNA polymerase III subunit gamma/tau [Pelistega europaea]|uniref:DNA polymerase III subunit gamma/tau n=1 Tax=Pelistega europaea TaxID=106147 RepID=A0A7Y4P673_9BURK|nr:DNA polymerase III subunit gamma/tau [Pelistega europaea]NOL49470.1 DNA polymerase III subunit gamma/tau [Pelistega europaea]
MSDNYLVLARKWRPRTFETLVGQDHVVKALSNALSTQRLHHAWLFTGTRGVGKTTLARILAKSLNCEQGISPHPCGVCQACTEIDQGRFVDYLEFDAASNRRVEEMTQLLEQAIYAPSVGRFKIYTIDEVHMLTGHAFNAMLKTLEEPPPHVKFILATTDPQKIPVTVLSRCLQFNLKQMTPEAIVGHLQNILTQESVQFDKEGLRLLAQAAAGSMRDALSLTDQAIAYSGGNITADATRDMLGTIDQRYLVRFLQQLLAGSAQGLMEVASELTTRGFSFSRALEDLASLLSKIAIEQRIPGTIGAEDVAHEDVVQLAQSIHPDVLQLFYSIAIHSRAELALSPDEYTGFIMAGLRMLSLVSPAQMMSGGLASPQTGHDVSTSSVAPGQMASAMPNQPVEAVSNTVNSATTVVADTQKKTLKSVDDFVPAWEEVASPADKSNSGEATRHNQGLTSAPVTTPIDASMAAPADASMAAPADASVPAPADTSGAAPADATVAVLTNAPTSVSTDLHVPAFDDIPPPTDEDIAFLPASMSDDDINQMVDTDPSWVPQQGKQTYTLAEMDAEKWIQLMQSFHLTGMVGELAKHTEWVGVHDNTITLRLLIRIPDNSSAKAKLATLLTEYFKVIVKLQVEFGATDHTAFVMEQAEQQRRQHQAEQAVQASPLVQALQRDFQAVVVPDSIRPYQG